MKQFAWIICHAVALRRLILGTKGSDPSVYVLLYMLERRSRLRS